MKKFMIAIALWLLNVIKDDIAVYSSLQDKLHNSPTNKRVRKCFYIFFGLEDYDIPVNRPSYIQLGITDIISEQIGSSLYIRVTLERPGLLIGKAGSTIDAVRQFLCEDFDIAPYQLKLDIKESRMWIRMFN